MKELVDQQTSWHRSLWQVGTIVGLREIVEATELTWLGQLTTDGAMRDFIIGLDRQVELDKGLGKGPVRDRYKLLLKTLSAKPTDKMRGELSALKELTERSRSNYLGEWAAEITDQGVRADEVELVARLVIAHLLDEGFHRVHIHGWLTNTGSGTDLLSVLARAEEMLEVGKREFSYLVPLAKLPTAISKSIETIRVDSDEYVERYKASQNASQFASARKPAAALRLSFIARDPHSGLALVGEWMQKFWARVAVGSPTLVRYEDEVVDVSAATPKIRSLTSHRRQVRIPSVQRNDLFSAISSDDRYNAQIDDAIGLIAAQRQSPSGPSIASTWAAVEGLLGRPGGKGVESADRLADIVTCSFPRAELNELAKRWEKVGDDQLASDIKGEIASGKKVGLMLEFLESSGDPGFEKAADVAAVARLRQLSSSPVATLMRVRGYYRSVFRRLYYQRNFVMHAAKFDSVSLPTAIRAAPQLVAAGVDRIVNAQFSEQALSPLALASRAENELSLVATSASRPLYALLD